MADTKKLQTFYLEASEFEKIPQKCQELLDMPCEFLDWITHDSSDRGQPDTRWPDDNIVAVIVNMTSATMSAVHVFGEGYLGQVNIHDRGKYVGIIWHKGWYYRCLGKCIIGAVKQKLI